MSDGPRRQRTFLKSVNLEVGRKRRVQCQVHLRDKYRSDELNRKRVQPDSQADVGVAIATVTMSEEELMAEYGRVTAALCSGSAVVKYEGVLCVKKLLAMEVAPVENVVQAGTVPLLVECLKDASEVSLLRSEAASCLSTIASNKHCSTVVEHGAVALLVQLVTPQRTLEEREQAVWGLATLAAESRQARLQITECEGVPLLAAVIGGRRSTSLLRNTVWCLSSLSLEKDCSCALTGVLSAVNNLLFETDEDILVDACWFLANITNHGLWQITEIMAHADGSVPRRLADILSSSIVPTIVPILRTFGNIATGSAEHVDLLIQLDVLPMMCYLLAHQKKATRREVCWAVSNITAGPPYHVQACIEANLVPPLIQCIQLHEVDVAKEAAWAICNATNEGTPDQLAYLVSHGIVAPLVELLRRKDDQQTSVVLEGFHHLLVAAKDETQNSLRLVPSLLLQTGCIEMLEDLQERSGNPQHATLIDAILAALGGDEATADETSRFQHNDPTPPFLPAFSF